MRKPKKEKAQLKKLNELGFVKKAKIVKVGRGICLRIKFKETVLSITSYTIIKKKRIKCKNHFYLGNPVIEIGLYSSNRPCLTKVIVYSHHPHISNSGYSFCFGDTWDLLCNLIGGFNFEMAVFIIWKWLHTYNKGHGYCGINTLTSRFFHNSVPIWNGKGKRMRKNIKVANRWADYDKNKEALKDKKLEGLL